MKTCLILGGAECVFDDAEAALKLFEPDIIIAVNDIVLTWKGRIDILVTLHPEKFAAKAIAAHPGIVVWSHQLKSDAHRMIKDWGGSSGLLAVKVALNHLQVDSIN